MLSKLLVGAFLALTMLTSSAASPATEERKQFCLGIAELAADVATDKTLGLEKQEFLQRLQAMADALKNDFTKEQIAEAVAAGKKAYADGGSAAARAQDAFKACIQRPKV